MTAMTNEVCWVVDGLQFESREDAVAQINQWHDSTFSIEERQVHFVVLTGGCYFNTREEAEQSISIKEIQTFTIKENGTPIFFLNTREEAEKYKNILQKRALLTEVDIIKTKTLGPRTF